MQESKPHVTVPVSVKLKVVGKVSGAELPEGTVQRSPRSEVPVSHHHISPFKWKALFLNLGHFSLPRRMP